MMHNICLNSETYIQVSCKLVNWESFQGNNIHICKGMVLFISAIINEIINVLNYKLARYSRAIDPSKHNSKTYTISRKKNEGIGLYTSHYNIK